MPLQIYPELVNWIDTATPALDWGGSEFPDEAMRERIRSYQRDLGAMRRDYLAHLHKTAKAGVNRDLMTLNSAYATVGPTLVGLLSVISDAGGPSIVEAHER